MKDKKNIVLVFAKWPELGLTKKRIAKETSPKFALEFSRACLNDLIGHLADSDYYDLMVGVDTESELKLFDKNYGLEGILTRGDLTKDKQQSQSQKFHNLFGDLLRESKYDNAVLIPMDLPFLIEEEMISSFVRLNSKPFVHGPESNGGVYLIGVRSPYKHGIFGGVRWSTPNSYNDLIMNCGKENVYELKTRADLNTFQDILNAKKGIAHHCEDLFDLLVQKGYYISNKDRYIDFDTLPINLSVVSAIVHRGGGKGKEILIQTRYKPNIDPSYTGRLELPCGLVDRYEPIQKAVTREVKEETGLDVKVVNLSNQQQFKSENHKDFTISFLPYACNQQLIGGRAYFGVVFLCDVIGGQLKGNYHETRDPHWIGLNDLNNLLINNPEKIFPFHIPVLKQYLDEYKGE